MLEVVQPDAIETQPEVAAPPLLDAKPLALYIT
jgi:hypothetical protein